MHEVVLFAEDLAHEIVLGALLRRLQAKHDIKIDLRPRSVRGGHGRTLAELKEYVRDLSTGREKVPDLLLVASDGNCMGWMDRQRLFDPIITPYADRVICAVPDPDVERWLLLDSAAFKAVLGKGCDSPDYKCERDRYKELLLHAVRQAGVTPLLGGLEHAEAIVQVMDLDRTGRRDKSLGRLLESLEAKLAQWEQ